MYHHARPYLARKTSFRLLRAIVASLRSAVILMACHSRVGQLAESEAGVMAHLRHSRVRVSFKKHVRRAALPEQACHELRDDVDTKSSTRSPSGSFAGEQPHCTCTGTLEAALTRSRRQERRILRQARRQGGGVREEEPVHCCLRTGGRTRR